MDYAAGARIFHTTRMKRVKEAHRRTGKLASLRRYGKQAARIAKMSVSTAALFGMGVTGVQSSHVKSIRSSLHRCLVKKPVGRSAAMDLSRYPGMDPWHGAYTAPVVMLATALQDGWLGRAMIPTAMTTALSKGIATIRQAAGPIAVAVVCCTKVSLIHI